MFYLFVFVDMFLYSVYKEYIDLDYNDKMDVKNYLNSFFCGKDVFVFLY